MREVGRLVNDLRPLNEWIIEKPGNRPFLEMGRTAMTVLNASTVSGRSGHGRSMPVWGRAMRTDPPSRKRKVRMRRHRFAWGGLARDSQFIRL